MKDLESPEHRAMERETLQRARESAEHAERERQAFRDTGIRRGLRIAALILGILTWLVFGATIFAMLINPRTWLDFWLAIYFGIAGILAIAQFFSKRLWQLVIALPGVIWVGGVGPVGLLINVIRGE